MRVDEAGSTYSTERRLCGRFDSLQFPEGKSAIWLVTDLSLQLTNNSSPLYDNVVSCNTDRSLLHRERVLTDPRGHDWVEVGI